MALADHTLIRKISPSLYLEHYVDQHKLLPFAYIKTNLSFTHYF